MFRRLFALIAATALGYATYVYGVSYINSSFFVAYPEDDTPPLWQYQKDQNLLSSEALVVKATRLQEQGEDIAATQQALKALSVDPSSGRAASFLLAQMVQRDENGKADMLADLSSKLWPAHTFTRARLAEYWVNKDRLDKVIEEWNVLLIRSPQIRPTLFPLMATIIQDDNSSVVFRDFIADPPVWWNPFFIYLSRELPLDRLRLVYAARASSDFALDESERRHFVNRLIKEKSWGEAFNYWYVGLSDTESKYSGYLYDGGFESGLYNQPFTWVLSRSKNPLIKTDITYGIKGRRALKVVLRGKEPLNFRHVSQRMLLEPANYEFSLRYRADSIKAQKGLTWRIRCLSDRRVIAETDPIFATAPWTTFEANFSVDDSCDVQQLILESTSRFRHERSITGTLWFDQLTIRKKTGPK